MKTIKALALVIFLVAIFLCVRVYLNETLPRVIYVSQPGRSETEKVADRTGTGVGSRICVSLHERTICVFLCDKYYVPVFTSIEESVWSLSGQFPHIRWIQTPLSDSTFSPSYACTAAQLQRQQDVSKTRMKVRCTLCMLLHT